MLKLVHVGYVVPSIDSYLTNSFLTAISAPVYDPLQQARVCLVEVGWGHDMTLELIQPVEKTSTVQNFLDKTHGGLHHLCFEVDSMAEADRLAATKRMVKVLGPVAAVLFEGRLVSFYYGRNREILEFVERKM